MVKELFGGYFGLERILHNFKNVRFLWYLLSLSPHRIAVLHRVANSGPSGRAGSTPAVGVLFIVRTIIGVLVLRRNPEKVTLKYAF